MVDPGLPDAEEVPHLVPSRDSIVWRRSSDARGFLAPGYALLLQVAHPVVGAGVAEHSDYRRDPWKRLLHTLDFLNVVIYGGPERAARMGRAVRERHRSIKGEMPDGSRYFALNREPYAWVHATLVEAIVTAQRHFGRPFTRAETEEFYAEWRLLGRLFGVREQDLPEDWAGFRLYFDEKVEGTLGDNQAVQDVLATLTSPDQAPLPTIPASAWKVARLPAGHVLRLTTVGLLPPVLRERFGLRWSRRQALELRALERASRSATPLLPRSLRRVGPVYLNWRDDQLVYPSAPSGEARAA